MKHIKIDHDVKINLRRYVCGRGIDQPVLMEDAGNLEKYYYHCNALGSAALLTDSAGFVVERYENDTYGTTIAFDFNFANPRTESLFGNPYRFTSRHFDNESGLYYYRARHYHPTQGRFLQRDPIGYDDPNCLLNLYCYVGNNPVNKSDPSGLRELTFDEKKLNEEITQISRKLAEKIINLNKLKKQNPDLEKVVKELSRAKSQLLASRVEWVDLIDKGEEGSGGKIMFVGMVTTQADSPIPGPADIVGAGIIAVGGTLMYFSKPLTKEIQDALESLADRSRVADRALSKALEKIQCIPKIDAVPPIELSKPDDDAAKRRAACIAACDTVENNTIKNVCGKIPTTNKRAYWNCVRDAKIAGNKCRAGCE